MKTAACILCIRGDKVLAVSRKDDFEDLGLPGGKVDSGETPREAAIRELKEETGLDPVGSVDLVFVHKGKSSMCFTYFVEDVTGDIVSSEEGRVTWAFFRDLCKGSFKVYNKALFKRLGLYKCDK